MSTHSATGTSRTTLGIPTRYLALASLVVLLGSFLAVLYDVTDIVGRRDQFVLLVVVTFAAATLVGKTLRPAIALTLTLLILGGGFGIYILSLPESQLALLSFDQLASDSLALASGLSVLRLVAADVWALAVTPAPLFLAWYFAVRGRYGPAVVVAGVGLGLFVLTGDADGLLTLVGVCAGAAALGFDSLDRFGASGGQLDALILVVAAMIVVAATVSVLPGAGAAPIIPNSGLSDQPTVEASLVSSTDSVGIVGSISLSPEVRFEVESNTPSYWQTAAFDRYTGNGWVRTGNTAPYSGGRLDEPPGPSRRVEQTVTPATPLDAMPAAWRPLTVDGDVASETLVTTQGTIRPGRTIERGENYTVTSAIPQYTAASLRRTGTDYPDEIRDRYLALPDSTSDRVRQQAATITADAETPYDKAVAIERWLEENKEYSLQVSRPDGDIVEGFLFEMDSGYCTYYASSMVVLLRSEGVPARFVTGYTTGEPVEDGRYVVRGLDAHAWVEVYFEDTGWVRFDPTPTEPRRAAEDQRLVQARDDGEQGVDTNETRPETPENTTETETSTPNNSPDSTATPAGNDSNASNLGPGLDDRLGITPPASGGSQSNGGLFSTTPSRETMFVWFAGFVGIVAGARRLRVPQKLWLVLYLVFQRRTDQPTEDVLRAYDRLERILERTYRPRRSGETVRNYLDALSRVGVDTRTQSLGVLYERARYGRGVSREDATEAVSIANDAIRSRLPVLKRWGR
ncbi:DUF3488 and DUF4129 domain-containing transglutaminase family protein [Haloferax namakaokahaiae]|uniref:DUF3488 and DUF4129 domain-containing transglutaminase family protein n=1 Tax=Haloferax namakaokahaiae TaxID=1748331 RepID=A0ABD5ZC50_9EURY